MLWWFRGFTFKDKNIIFINHQQHSCMIVWRKLRGFWEKSAEKHQALMALQMIGWILNNNWPAATHPDVHSDQILICYLENIVPSILQIDTQNMQ